MSYIKGDIFCDGTSLLNALTNSICMIVHLYDLITETENLQKRSFLTLHFSSSRVNFLLVHLDVVAYFKLGLGHIFINLRISLLEFFSLFLLLDIVLILIALILGLILMLHIFILIVAFLIPLPNRELASPQIRLPNQRLCNHAGINLATGYFPSHHVVNNIFNLSHND